MVIVWGFPSIPRVIIKWNSTLQLFRLVLYYMFVSFGSLLHVCFVWFSVRCLFRLVLCYMFVSFGSLLHVCFVWSVTCLFRLVLCYMSVSLLHVHLCLDCHWRPLPQTHSWSHAPDSRNDSSGKRHLVTPQVRGTW